MSALPLAASGLPGGGIDLDPWVGLLLGLLLVLLNGFFVSAEFALVKVRPTQIDPYAAEGMRRGKVARHMISHLDAYLSATQLGITLASLALGWIGEPAFAWIVRPAVVLFTGREDLVHSVALTVSFLVITILHIVLGELAPKSIAIRKPEATSLFVALPLYGFYKLTYPAIWLLNHTASSLLRVMGIQPATESELAHDEEELRRLLAASGPNRLPDQKREILDNVFELSHRVARQIMMPRADVIYLSTTRSLAENLRLARRSGHTRYPLCEGDLDHVVGLVHIKDIFRADRPIRSLEEVARPIVFVPETLQLDRLLRRMLSERFQLAAVIDEYGGVSGVVTLENVIEEIVGEIQDEFDAEKPELAPGPEGSYEVSGAMLVEDLEDALDLELSDRDEDTIGGVVLSELGRQAAVGDTVEVGPVTLEVTQVHLNRIESVKVTLKTAETVSAERE